MATAGSAAPPPTTAVATTSTPDEPSPEQIMVKFLQKFGRGAKASDFFARMAAACQQEEAVSTLTPLEIPPRSSTLQETPTSQAITSHTENPQKLSETLAPVFPRAEAAECPPREGSRGGRRDDKEGGEGGDDEEKTQDEEGSEKGDKPVDKDTVVTGEGIAIEEEVDDDEKTGDEEGDERDDAEDIGKGRKPEEVDEEDVAGIEGRETDEFVEGEIPEVVGEEIPAIVEGEIPAIVEGEIPAVVEGEIHVDVPTDMIVEEVVDVDDDEDVRTAQAVDVSVEEPVREGLKDIVVLEDEPDDGETPVDERTTRRNTHRARQVDELAAVTRARKLQFGTSEGDVETGEEIPEVQETPDKEEEVAEVTVERRYTTESKRKGKQEDKPLKKKPRQVFSTVVIKEPTSEPSECRLPSR